MPDPMRPREGFGGVLRGSLIVVQMPANANSGQPDDTLLLGRFARRLSAHVAPIMAPFEVPLNRLDKWKDEVERNSPRNRSKNAPE